MKKVIDGKLFDTDKAEHIHGWSNGVGRSDFKAREKDLYKTKNGRYFIKHFGGAMTDMAETYGGYTSGSSSIEPVSERDAFRFLNSHGATKLAIELFPDQFEDA